MSNYQLADLRTGNLKPLRLILIVRVYLNPNHPKNIEEKKQLKKLNKPWQIVNQEKFKQYQKRKYKQGDKYIEYKQDNKDKQYQKEYQQQ